MAVMQGRKRPPGRPRNLGLREKILTTAGRLFWQKGYDQTSLNDIARAANINKATIYYHFKGKAVILYEVATRAMEAIASGARAVDRTLPADQRLAALVSNHIRYQTSHVGLAGIGQTERRNLPPRLLKAYLAQRDEYEAFFQQAVADLMSDGKCPYLEPKLATLFVLGLASSIMQWYKPDGGLSSDEIASAALAFISKALVLPEIDTRSCAPQPHTLRRRDNGKGE